MKRKGVNCQKLNPVPGIPLIRLVKENIEKEKIMNPATSKTTGIRCEIRERFAWNLISRSCVMRKMMTGTSKGAKKTLK
jgi:hypothetical protein